MSTRLQELQGELENAYARIDDLELHIRSGAELLDAESLEEILDEFDSGDDETSLVPNGIFTDALHYGAHRVEARKARKKTEKAAIAAMRAAEARKNL